MAMLLYSIHQRQEKCNPNTNTAQKMKFTTKDLWEGKSNFYMINFLKATFF